MSKPTYLDFEVIELPTGVSVKDAIEAANGYDIELEYNKDDEPFDGKVILRLHASTTPPEPANETVAEPADVSCPVKGHGTFPDGGECPTCLHGFDEAPIGDKVVKCRHGVTEGATFNDGDLVCSYCRAAKTFNAIPLGEEYDHSNRRKVNLWAFRFPEFNEGRWHITDDADLLEIAGELRAHGHSEQTSHLIRGNVLAPKWWAPDSQYLSIGASAMCHHPDAAGALACAQRDGWKAITLDLLTGEEVPVHA